MKTLNTLIKFHQQQLDVLRRQMGSLESQKGQLLAMVERIRDEMKREIELAQKNAELGMLFGDYVKRIRAREVAAHKEVKELEKKMDVLREEIRDAFIELKKFETARDNRKKELRQKADRRETEQLDEIAGQRHEKERLE
jgi:flagellar export protein FliJ